MLRGARVQSRPAAQTMARQKEAVLPAPVGGWVSNASIARENPGAAEVMENFIPTSRGVRARGGSITHATVGLLTVETLMVYSGVSSSSLFAVSSGSIYDISTPVTPSTIPSAAVSALTSSKFSYVNFATAGGQFLLAFNGTNPHLVFDGTAWASNVPAITGVSSANINQSWVHGNRIWMTQEDSVLAWYLPVDSIGGAALSFAVPFERGGKLLFGASWSQDSGEGSADRCVFVSDQGEVIAYVGDDPSSAATWRVFGQYNAAKPLGRFATQKFGGDLAIMTVNGIVPMSEVVTKDPAALTATAITKYIEPDWKNATAEFGERNWSFLKWDKKNLGIVAIPSATISEVGTSIWGETFQWGRTPWGSGWTIDRPVNIPTCFVVNLDTGRWCKITGWDCQSLVVYNGEFYFGTSSGLIVRGDVGGSDQGNTYECRIAYWPSQFGYFGEKQFLQASGVFEHGSDFNPKITMSVGNLLSWASAPAIPGNSNVIGAWDVARWDQSTWDLNSEKLVKTTRWISLNRRGRVGAILLQMSFNNLTTPDVEFTDVTLTYEEASVVV